MEKIKKCPFCGEEILAVAIKCKHCHSMLNEHPKEENNSIGKELIKVNANLFRGFEAVGGKLTVTNKRLIFNSHSFNIQSGTTEILFKDIADVQYANTAFILHTKLIIRLKNKMEYSFVLNKRDIVAKYILENIN